MSNLGGRPKAIEDTEQNREKVKLMGQFRATYETMAGHFDVDKRTIDRYMTDEEGWFCRCYKTAFSETKQKLSEAQIHHALEGNATLLIWLGKQHLEQVDRKETDVTTKGESLNKIDLKKLTTEQLNTLTEIMEE